MTKRSIYVVYQHDQGRKDEVDSWSTYREANERINEITTDIQHHPQWYQHLADPWWTIEKHEVTEPDFLGIVEI